MRRKRHGRDFEMMLAVGKAFPAAESMSRPPPSAGPAAPQRPAERESADRISVTG